MVQGWTRFSNWEARIMYMKTIDRAKARRARRTSVRAPAPARRRAWCRRRAGSSGHRGTQRSSVGHREPGATEPGGELALRVETVDPRCARHPLDPGHAFELRHASALPRNQEPPDRRGVRPVLLRSRSATCSPRRWRVLEARDLLVPRQEPDRRPDPLRVDAKIRARARSISTRSSGLSSRSVVSASRSRGIPGGRAGSPRTSKALEIGSLRTKSISKDPPPMLNPVMFRTETRRS